jgi:hypothetical protein
MTTVIISQGMGPSPYALQQEPMRWEEFLRDVKAGEYFRARITDEPNVRASWGTVAYRERDGFVMVHDMHLDSSG